MDSRHGDEEKQWAHAKKSGAGAGMGIEKQKREELQFRECRVSAT